MPLDDLQKAVLHVLLKNRSPESVFAGGSVLHRHGHRLSNDQDIFHSASADLVGIAEQDITSLHNAGMAADISRMYAGFVEAAVGNESQGRTRIQWVQASEWTFFEPVPDPEYGWRLHMADIATNKVLAAADRHEVRDYVDLLFIHRHVMPLWHAMWAAPGKDEAWSPSSIAERIATSNNFRQSEINGEIISTTPISASVLGQGLRTAIDEARHLFTQIPTETAGHLFIDKDSIPVLDANRILTDRENSAESIMTISTKRGGAWPSNPDIDRLMIEKIIDIYGHDGDKSNKPSNPLSRSLAFRAHKNRNEPDRSL